MARVSFSLLGWPAAPPARQAVLAPRKWFDQAKMLSSTRTGARRRSMVPHTTVCELIVARNSGGATQYSSNRARILPPHEPYHVTSSPQPQTTFLAFFSGLDGIEALGGRDR